MINRCRNLDDLPNRSCPPCYLQHGRVYTNHLNSDTTYDFAGTLPDHPRSKGTFLTSPRIYAHSGSSSSSDPGLARRPDEPAFDDRADCGGLKIGELVARGTHENLSVSPLTRPHRRRYDRLGPRIVIHWEDRRGRQNVIL